jgi:DNA adenine methylase
VGGKTQILDNVIPLFPKVMNNYHEPFVGGGSVLFALLEEISEGNIKVEGKIYASDLNANLIGLYQNIQKYPEELVVELKKMVLEFNECQGTTIHRKPVSLEEAKTSPESYFYWIRSKFNQCIALSPSVSPSVYASAMMLFLNKTCFRGVYREGPNGFNVPFGNYKNPSIFEEEHVRKVSEILQNVIFTVGHFQETLNKITRDDFIYLDPPYAPETEKSFVSYTSSGFNLNNHQMLFELCQNMKKKKAKFVMSNANVDLVKNAFPSSIYTTRIISCKRSIHSKNPSSRTNEVLITNFD